MSSVCGSSTAVYRVITELRVFNAFVQGDGGVDQREVGEGLREVPDLLPGQGDLIGEQADVVGVSEQTRLSVTSSTSIARRVEVHSGSCGAMKPTDDIRSSEESSTGLS